MGEFKDQLLVSCLELFLAVPATLVYSQTENNIDLWVDIFHKVFEMGSGHIELQEHAVLFFKKIH